MRSFPRPPSASCPSCRAGAPNKRERQIFTAKPSLGYFNLRFRFLFKVGPGPTRSGGSVRTPPNTRTKRAESVPPPPHGGTTRRRILSSGAVLVSGRRARHFAGGGR